jgi:hypothetical protein
MSREKIRGGKKENQQPQYPKTKPVSSTTRQKMTKKAALQRDCKHLRVYVRP